MLRQLRDNSRSLLIWVLFAIIIGFFIISFGPQASGDQFSCAGRDTYVVKVNDGEVSENSWRFGMNGFGFGGGSSARAQQARARETVMDGLIDRELFAQLAEDQGFRIPDSMIESHIANGDVFILGRAVPGKQIYFDENGGFDFDRLELYIGSLGMNNVAQFRSEQKRELLANLGRQTILQSARVSPEEVLARYRQENTTVTFDYVKWDPEVYERGLDPSPAQVSEYLASHGEDVKKKFETDARLYKGVKPQVKARHIFVRRDNPVPAPVPEGADAVDAGTGQAPDPTLDPGHAKASAARARIARGQSFAAVAKELSDDTRTKARGGYLGWRSATSVVGGPEVAEAVKNLKDGEVSEVITTDRGFYVVTIEAHREGDLAYDDVKLEIAENMALEFFGSEGARQDAQAALEHARSSGKSLADLFPKPVIDKGMPNVIEGEEPEDENKTGLIVHEGPNIPASLQAKDRVAPPAGADATDDQVPIPVDVPRPADLPTPTVASSGAIVRSGPVIAGPGMNPYIGRSPELAQGLFGSLEEGKLAPVVYQVDQAYVIVQITERSDPDMENFAKQKSTLSERYRREKNQRTVDDWALQRCRVVAERGDISVNASFVTYSDPDSDKPRPLTYKLCSGGGLPQM